MVKSESNAHACIHAFVHNAVHVKREILARFHIRQTFFTSLNCDQPQRRFSDCTHGFYARDLFPPQVRFRCLSMEHFFCRALQRTIADFYRAGALFARSVSLIACAASCRWVTRSVETSSRYCSKTATSPRTSGERRSFSKDFVGSATICLRSVHNVRDGAIKTRRLSTVSKVSKVTVDLYPRFIMRNSPLKRSGVARVNLRSHSFTCHPQVSSQYYVISERIVPNL